MHKKLEIYLFIAIWNHGNPDKLLFFNTYELKIKNLFESTWSFGLVKDSWKWKKLSLKKDIFTKNFQRTHITKISWW
jgi:hypothetical protein